jgi:hypothetical protein
MKFSMAERKKGVAKIAFIFYSWRATKEVYVTGQEEVRKLLPSISYARRIPPPPGALSLRRRVQALGMLS